MAIVKWNRWVPSILDDDFWPTTNLGNFSQSLDFDLYEEDGNIVVEVPVPGVPEDKVEVSIEGNVLMVNASNEETEERKSKKSMYKGSRQRTFNYSVSLPRMVNAKDANASIKDGVLQVTIPVAEEEKRKRIEVKSTKEIKGK